MTPLISTAEIFVAQSPLSVDEPDGEYTSGNPTELFKWVNLEVQKVFTLRANKRQTAVLIFKDNSSAIIQIKENTIKVGQGPSSESHSEEELSLAIKHMRNVEWNLVGTKTPSGQEYRNEIAQIWNETISRNKPEEQTMANHSALVSFESKEACDQFIGQANAMNATVEWATFKEQTATNNEEPRPENMAIVTMDHFNALAEELHAHIKMEYGGFDMIQWPETPMEDWTVEDKQELLQMAVQRWEFNPHTGNLRKAMLIEDIEDRMPFHLGKTKGE